MKRPFEFDLASCLGGELLEAPPVKVEKLEPVVAPEPPVVAPPTPVVAPPPPVVAPPPPPPASPVRAPVRSPVRSPPVSRPRTPDPMAVLSPADAALAALLNDAPPPQQHEDAPTSSETPPRCPTPDPLSVLSPEQALLASLLDGGALGDGGSGEVRREPPPSGAAAPNWYQNGSPGILREEGGVKQWMRNLNL